MFCVRTSKLKKKKISSAFDQLTLSLKEVEDLSTSDITYILDVFSACEIIDAKVGVIMNSVNDSRSEARDKAR